MDVSPLTSIYDVKRRIYARYGIPLEQQRLIFDCRSLRDDRTLSFYRIQNGSKLHLVTQLRGDIGVFGDHAGEPGTCLLEAGRASPAPFADAQPAARRRPPPGTCRLDSRWSPAGIPLDKFRLEWLNNHDCHTIDRPLTR